MTIQKPTSITRTELHALVWREPRSKLAGIWGISDVAIGKLCVKECIPAPPPGYWAKRAAGGRVSTTPLPMRLPGQRELIELRAVNYYERWNAPVDLESEITPPTYIETVEEVVQSAFVRLGPFRAKRDLSDPHHGLRRVLLSESKRAEKIKERDWSFDKPRFLEPRFQRQLRLFSSIFFILDSIHASCEVVQKETWIQGVGHIHHLIASVSIGGSSVQLQFLEPENPKGNNDLPRSSVTTLRVGSSGKGGNFVDEPGAKIEKRLEDIVKAILTLAETKMRSADFSIYERKLERRNQMLEAIAERKRKEEAMRLAAIKARKEAIRKEIADAAANLRRAQDIRSLVAAMAGHPDCVGEQSANYLSRTSRNQTSNTMPLHS
ncbi:hypothetical protein [Rhodoferax ferrireducens]|uniref:hypothetical protein n=1 Tax=Rhodoferax ferrireducens TaxID=192843 RepID=UPI003BB76565